MAAATATDVQKAYLAYFGRPADPVGLAYWTGKDTATMKAGFAASAEYATLYAGMTSAQMVAQVYTNLLGRTAEAAGLLYWSNALANGTATVSTLVDQMQANALGDDVTTINNRVTYATAFTAALDTTAEIVGYSGTTAANAARAAVLPITTDASLTTATAALNASVSTVTTASTSVSSGVAGLTFTLTAGNDVLDPNSATAATKTTANDDLIRSVATGDLGTADNINGGDGNDTLKTVETLTATATAGGGAKAATGTAQPVIANVENFKVDADLTANAAAGTAAADDASATYTLNFADVTGEKEVLLSGATIAATGGATAKTANGTATATFSNITLGTVVGLENTSVTATGGATSGLASAVVSFGFAAATGAADAATLKLADATVSVAGKTANATANVDIDSIENLTINSVAGTLSAVTSNTLILDGDSYETITVTGSQALTLTATAAAQAALKTFDASAMTANTTVTLAANVDLTIKGGTKNDTVNVTAGAKKVVVEAGEGNDTINVTNANGNKLITLSGGAGNDVFSFSADLDNVEDVTNDAKILENIIKITDWNAGDKIDIATLADLTTITDTQRDAITAKLTLKAAIEQAATHTAGGDQIVWFTWDGNTYVYQDSATVGFAAGDDGLIQIAGVHTLATTDFI